MLNMRIVDYFVFSFVSSQHLALLISSLSSCGKKTDLSLVPILCRPYRLRNSQVPSRQVYKYGDTHDPM